MYIEIEYNSALSNLQHRHMHLTRCPLDSYASWLLRHLSLGIALQTTLLGRLSNALNIDIGTTVLISRVHHIKHTLVQ